MSDTDTALRWIVIACLLTALVVLFTGCGLTSFSDAFERVSTPYSEIDTSAEPGIQPPTSAFGSPADAVITSVPRVVGNPLDVTAWGDIFTAAFTAVMTLTGVWTVGKTAGKVKEKSRTRRIAEIESVVKSVTKPE